MFYRLPYMTRPKIGELEVVVLLVVLHLGDEAYGAEIRREVQERTGRDYSVGAVYASLRRLEDKGFLRSFESDPIPVRGGRSRRYFQPTTAGRAALRTAIAEKRRLWNSLTTAVQPR
jgi:DNA-binding PadR family transcriptional regulator